jgi:hypothetical protein
LPPLERFALYQAAWRFFAGVLRPASVIGRSFNNRCWGAYPDYIEAAVTDRLRSWGSLMQRDGTSRMDMLVALKGRVLWLFSELLSGAIDVPFADGRADLRLRAGH